MTRDEPTGRTSGAAPEPVARHRQGPSSAGAVSAVVLFVVMLSMHLLLAQATELAGWARTVLALGAGLVAATATQHLVSRSRRRR
ncbi:hypothetical protein [Nesterenkonia sp. K-15-9-6]|uniref:hypothetical protein n=1 Tax=Nesterenkonia sp. K-15-9-6 TaxID=3093918 RepID=UPI002683F45B